MSFWVTSHRWLSLRPRIRYADSVLTLSTGLLERALSFGLHGKRVVLDGERRLIRVSHWVFLTLTKDLTLPFDEVAYLEYEFDAYGREWAPWFTGFMRQDCIEAFTIRAVDTRENRHTLWRFWGEGSSATGPEGVAFGDDWWDMQGTQSEDSRAVLKRMRSILNVPLGKPALTKEAGKTCAACNHLISRTSKKCLYCGAPQ